MAPCQSNDEIAAVVKDQPDFLAGVRAWVDAVGEPMSWYQWQSGIAKVRLWFPDTAFDTRAPGYTREVSELRKAEMLRAFGPAYEDDPRAPLLLPGGSPPAAPVPSPVGDGRAAGSAAQPGLTAAQLAMVPVSAPQHFSVGTYVPPASAPPGSVRSVATGVSRRSLPLQALQARMEEGTRASIGKIKASAQRLGGSDGSGSLDFKVVLSEDGHDLMVDFAAVSSETTAEHEERTGRMVTAFLVRGFPEKEAAMADQIEVIKRALVAEHESYAAMTGSTEGARVWAHEHLFSLDFSGIADPEELEVQVRALSLIAEASYEAATRWIMNLWATSPASTGSKVTESAQLSVPKVELAFQSPPPVAAALGGAGRTRLWLWGARPWPRGRVGPSDSASEGRERESCPVPYPALGGGAGREQ